MKASIHFFASFVVGVFISIQSFGQPEPAQAVVQPHEVVSQTTNKLMAVVKANQETAQSDPQKYYAEVQALLESVVDFEFIARSVMGPYWKTATAQQKEAFAQTFKLGLVETYAKGMAKFNDLNVEVIPPKEAVPEFGKVIVLQKVVAADGVNKMAYTMGRRKTDTSWKLLNVSLDGVSLGKTFRSQFIQSVKEHEGDLDKTIAGWAS